MDSRDLELSRPCPIDLDSLGVDRKQKRVFCSHCSAHVTDISKMREVEASAFVEANRGEGVCISYLRDSDGNVRFADSEPEDSEPTVGSPFQPSPALVPIERLRHPAIRRAAAVAVLALAACTPHGEHDEPYVESMDDVVMERTSPEIPLAEEPSLPPPTIEDVVPETPEAELADEPCDPETKPHTSTKKRKPNRGRLKPRAPVKPEVDWDRVDGGI